jgi:hypothetical protein
MKDACAQVLMAVSLVVGLFGHAQAASISLVPSSGTVMVGDAVDVFVYVMGLEADFDPNEIVSAYDLDVSYGGAVNAVGLTFGTSLGGPLDSLQDFNFLAGAVDFAEVSFLADADLAQLQGDTVLLATLIFQAVAPGTATLSFLSGADDVKGLNALPIWADHRGRINHRQRDSDAGAGARNGASYGFRACGVCGPSSTATCTQSIRRPIAGKRSDQRGEPISLAESLLTSARIHHDRVNAWARLAGPGGRSFRGPVP